MDRRWSLICTERRFEDPGEIRDLYAMGQGYAQHGGLLIMADLGFVPRERYGRLDIGVYVSQDTPTKYACVYVAGVVYADTLDELLALPVLAEIAGQIREGIAAATLEQMAAMKVRAKK
jgi:hypothetical protein